MALIHPHWRCKLVPDGPFVPVKVWFGPPLVDGEELDRSPRWQCLVRTETTSREILMMGEDRPVEVDGVHLRGLEPIKEGTYRYMVDRAAYYTRTDPKHPESQPTTPIDWSQQPPAFAKE